MLTLSGSPPIGDGTCSAPASALSPLTRLMPRALIPGARAALLGFGKMASREMTFTSDLDFILLYNVAELTEMSDAQLTRWRSQNVGFVFQMYNLIPVMTAVENVELPLLLTHLPRRKRRQSAMTLPS